mgnify:CR=1 FL=1
MATPNIVNVATINAKNAAGAITTSRAAAVDVPAEKVAKINTILIANIDGTNAADVTIEVSIDDGSNYIRKSLQTILPKEITDYDDKKNPDFTKYLYNSDRMYNIMSVNHGENIINKTYSVNSNERVNANSPYFDSITLLSSPNSEIDILRELIVGPTLRNTTQEVSLSDILEHLHETLDIKNLIVIDLACSVTSESERHERRSNRTGTPYGGYERKTKRNKKNN